MTDSSPDTDVRVHAFTDDALGDDDATGVAARIASGEVSATEVVEAAIARAAAVDRLHGIELADFDRARSFARSPGKGVFAGVPTVVKDNTDVAGLPSNQGSRAVHARPARRNAPITDQFLSTGLISLGKSRMPEFGLNASTEFEDGPATPNPWNTGYSAGASSGGSAVLVASGVVPIAHANDGGGSIRIPAAACGLVGLKFTRGRELPDDHAAQMPVNLVSNGALTRTVRDTARFAAQVERYRPARSMTPIGLVEGPAQRRLRIGIVDRSIAELPVDRETQAAVSATADRLAALGHDLVPIGLPLPEKDLVAFKDDFVHYWSMLGFALTRFGRRVMSPDFEASDLESLTTGLSKRFQRNFLRTPAALWRLRASEGKYRAAFAGDIDVMLSPTVAHTTPPLGHLSPANGFDVLFPRLVSWVAFTPLNNATGGPAISLPVEMSTDGMPLGVQLSADHGDEATLLALAYELEADRPFTRIQDA
ncbi:amidase [Williamsia deligens]|uniref:amidase n=1 Tax=Williamsia deligens TaxID=321325 RepID=A0ABW3G4P7_9NOCA|nr:amidase [Williamsia deligens]MCP2194242.1 amidase [Williamsia deligens]